MEEMGLFLGGVSPEIGGEPGDRGKREAAVKPDDGALVGGETNGAGLSQGTSAVKLSGYF
jgi:hypothetical protein